MDPEPKFINVSMRDGTRAVFLVAVKTKHVPGALGDLATRLGEAGVNILSMGPCSSPENPESALSLFVEGRDELTEAKDITRALNSSPYLLDSHVRKSDSKLLVDDFAFPLMFYPGGRGVLLPQTAVTGMFRDLTTMFGSGGASILYRAGESLGKTCAEQASAAFGEEDVIEEAAVFSKLFLALGWGRLFPVEADRTLMRFRLRLFDGFESSGAKAQKPNCHFSRGIVAGAIGRLFGRELTCVEELCAAAGDPCCEFVVAERPEGELSRSESPSS